MKVDIACNPASGRHNPAQLAQLVEAFRTEGFEASLVPVTLEGITFSPDSDLVCVYGGDGTLNLVARSMGKSISDRPLCVFPAGTINLVARELGYCARPQRFARQVARAFRSGSGIWTNSPVFSLGEQPILSCLSCGPDSAAVAACSPALKSRLGRFAYAAAMFSLLWKWPRQELTISAELVDGEQIETTAEAVFVARSRFYAGSFRLSRRACISNPDLEIVVMPRASRIRTGLFALALLARIAPSALGLARVFSARSVRIDGAILPIQIDGDIVPLTKIDIRPSGSIARYCI
ncbi:MAG: hypothetical protein KUG65_03875 [Sphingomonadaceae bacterium]|nr:hypothetical protein [Sphingomonadaceae bacterium]